MKNEMNKDKYFKRTIDDQLARWAADTNSKTIALINGARRIGKTYSLEYLGETQFEDYCVIEVDKLNANVVSLLTDKERRTHNFCDYLLANFGIPREKINGGLLVVFDEIQEHNELKESISVFNNGFDCRFACTGSALWINDTNGTRATPDYESFNIRPFSFRQFLTIIGEDNLIINEEALFNSKKDRNGDRNLLRLLRLYIAIGGMPQSVVCYLENKNDEYLYVKLNKLKKTSIVNTYENDLRRYQKKFNLKLLDEYKNIVRTIGRPKDITNSKEIYQKLEDMNIVICVKQLNDINKKIYSSFNSSLIKPFLLDSGLLFYYFCDDTRDDVVKSYYEDFVSGKDSDDNGYLYENYVASSLMQNEAIPFFKTFKGRNDEGKEKLYELDFVFTCSKGPVVLEAKSGEEKEHKSLTTGLKRYSKIKASYILCKHYAFDRANIQKGPHYIPFYALDYLMR